jgi:hypothetical protein
MGLLLSSLLKQARRLTNDNLKPILGRHSFLAIANIITSKNKYRIFSYTLPVSSLSTVVAATNIENESRIIKEQLIENHYCTLF